MDVPPMDDYVRVLLMTEGYKGIYHASLTVSCDEGMYVESDGIVKEYEPGQAFVVSREQFQGYDSIQIAGKNNGRIRLENLGRNGNNLYRGKLGCFNTENGIVAVNELLVEDYLYGVVPSEMPSDYPLEALKAQAISSRSYTYFHKQTYAYPLWKAHMDDSTAFQVYMNRGETPETCRAVDETKNKVLAYQDAFVESFYFSTSGGFNGGMGVWKDTATEQDGYLIESGEDIFAKNNDAGEAAYKEFIDNGRPEDVEYNEAWYRWHYDKRLDGENLQVFLAGLYELSASQKKNVKIRSKYLPADQLQYEKGIKDIRILNRRKSGLVDKMMIETEHFKVSVFTQHTIRQALCRAGDSAAKKDGSAYTMGSLLPSAYFYIEKIYDNTGENGDTLYQVIIHGAGLGHGCGMSQNGAKCLAERGFTAVQILSYYYNGEIKDVCGGTFF